ncbi:small ubiquitin-like modifier [Atractiella rhizophila]|nr:small ubiquitin-like modifier [Atractiella rhizophila]
MSDAEQAAPATQAKPETEHINIKVTDQSGAEVFFKIKTTTKLGKLMDAYADRQGKQREHVRFLYDGQRVGAEDTPAKLEMEDNDQIEVQIEQVGGR